MRYLGVDVGRVTQPVGRFARPGPRHRIVEIDSTAPISGATQAKLGLLGLTGLLYIDLQQESMARARRRCCSGDRYPVIRRAQGHIEAFLERLPDA